MIKTVVMIILNQGGCSGAFLWMRGWGGKTYLIRTDTEPAFVSMSTARSSPRSRSSLFMGRMRTTTLTHSFFSSGAAVAAAAAGAVAAMIFLIGRV